MTADEALPALRPDPFAAFFDWAVRSPHYDCLMEDEPIDTTRGVHLAHVYRAALPAASPALDVERLAQVIHAMKPADVGWASGPGRQGIRQFWPSRTIGSREMAEAIAAEYARLTEQEAADR